MQAVKHYIATTPWRDWTLERASADASFRRYFRLKKAKESVIVMDSSQEKTSLAPFIDVTNRLLHVAVNAPKILHNDRNAGFLILEDFGTIHYLDVLNNDNYTQLYTEAMQQIVSMQRADASDLPLYDNAFLLSEMELMPTWFLKRYLHVNFTALEWQRLQQTLYDIVNEVSSQPQGFFVHRDFHSRNIMLPPEGGIGIIDYQDAMSGALTYDLVSLLKDCYIAFDPRTITTLALNFRDMKAPDVDDATFMRWFDFTGMQRHIKVLGIFCRLHLRDGKSGYLNDLPLTLEYLIATALRYEKTRDFAILLQNITLPNITKELS